MDRRSFVRSMAMPAAAVGVAALPSFAAAAPRAWPEITDFWLPTTVGRPYEQFAYAGADCYVGEHKYGVLYRHTVSADAAAARAHAVLCMKEMLLKARLA